MGSKIASGAGLRHIRYYLLDSNGYPDTSSLSGSDGYAGRRLEGAKAFNANLPDANTIRHTGDDVVFAQDQLPPTELETATLTTGKTNLTADAELGNIIIREIGTDIELLSTGTDKAGQEAQIGLLAWRQALDTENAGASKGQRRYVNYLYHSAKMFAKGSTPQEGGADENSYNVVPTPVTQMLWGEDFTLEDDGYTTAVKSIFITEKPVMIEAYKAPGSVTTFLMDFAPITAAKTHAWVNGVPATVSSVNVTLKTFTLSVAPSANAIVVVLYESNNIV